MNLPTPDLQISFALALRDIRERCLQDALLAAHNYEAVKMSLLVNIDGLPTTTLAKIKQESPSTNRWYWISQISDPSSMEYTDFKSQITSAISI